MLFLEAAVVGVEGPFVEATRVLAEIFGILEDCGAEGFFRRCDEGGLSFFSFMMKGEEEEQLRFYCFIINLAGESVQRLPLSRLSHFVPSHSN